MMPFADITDVVPPVQWIVDLLHPVLLFFHDTIGVGWGVSIILLTVVVRALLAPLMVKQFKSMQAMVRLAPQLAQLQAEHQDDKQRQQQETMRFYRENKVNPFSSCLPLVAQMPFFVGLFWLLQTDLRSDICGQTARACGAIAGAGGAERFLFIPDLTAIATGWVLAVLVVLYIGSQLLSSLLTSQSADRRQRLIVYGLPFVFAIFVVNVPAGLVVYWITTNLWTLGQGYILRRRIAPLAALQGEPALAVATGRRAPPRLGTHDSPRDGRATKPSGSGSPRRPQSRSRKKRTRSGKRR
ncbi:MAG TPA: YidC/Oxa1 family membrane protein insertase [Solirubrobacteraceae bacterium]|jgi:YidC/Oxa1 family membrane protein insertase|nr:YidC/Oxa1 family membrane protein insertase [Solirubrobacteraceae bacterium]